MPLLISGLPSRRSIFLPLNHSILTRAQARASLAARASSSSNSHQNPSPPPSVPPEALVFLCRTVIATAVFAAAVTPPAHAEWHPRRHHRRIRDEALEVGAKARAHAREEASQAAAKAQEQLQQQQRRQAQPSDLFSQAKKSAEAAYRRLERAVRGENAPLYSVSVSGGRPDPGAYYGTSRGAEASPLGWWVVGLAAAGLAYAIWGKNLSWPWSGRRRQGGGGKWVRDRSLGGKMVFIPDTPLDESSTGSTPRPLWQDTEDFSHELASAAEMRTTVAAVDTEREAAVDAMPEWWAPPKPAKYVAESRKEEMRKQAKATLRELQDLKLAGQDYPLPLLVTMRRVCHEGGGLQVRPSTESGRDALLRAAVKYSTQAMLRRLSCDLGGYEPGRFVSGLAHDLGVPDKRAVNIVHGEVAANCRAALIEAEAAFRAADDFRLFSALNGMVAILGAYPFPRGSPEAELVGQTILGQTTMEFRKAVFMAAGSADLRVAPIVAEMLGFNPDLVMEQLKAALAVEAAAQAGAGAAPGGTTSSSYAGAGNEEGEGTSE